MRNLAPPALALGVGQRRSQVVDHAMTVEPPDHVQCLAIGHRPEAGQHRPHPAAQDATGQPEDVVTGQRGHLGRPAGTQGHERQASDRLIGPLVRTPALARGQDDARREGSSAENSAWHARWRTRARDSWRRERRSPGRLGSLQHPAAGKRRPDSLAFNACEGERPVRRAPRRQRLFLRAAKAGAAGQPGGQTGTR